MLTAAAYGCGDHCFVAPSDCGLGLFARSDLRAGQAIVEYYGPRVPNRQLVHSTFALDLPDGKNTFIDGDYDHSPLPGCGAPGLEVVRTPAIRTNHSRLPNCRLEHWPRRHRDAKPPVDCLAAVRECPHCGGISSGFDSKGERKKACERALSAAGPSDGNADTMWLVALEPVAAGSEVRAWRPW